MLTAAQDAADIYLHNIRDLAQAQTEARVAYLKETRELCLAYARDAQQLCDAQATGQSESPSTLEEQIQALFDGPFADEPNLAGDENA